MAHAPAARRPRSRHWWTKHHDFVPRGVELDGRAGDDEEARAHGDEDDELQGSTAACAFEYMTRTGSRASVGVVLDAERNFYSVLARKARAWWMSRVGTIDWRVLGCVDHLRDRRPPGGQLPRLSPELRAELRVFRGEGASAARARIPSMSASAEPPLAMLTHDAFMMPGRTHRANAAIAAPSASSWLVLDTDRISETDDGSAIGGSAAVFTTRAARTFFAQQLSTWILEATTSPPARWTAPAPAVSALRARIARGRAR